MRKNSGKYQEYRSSALRVTAAALVLAAYSLLLTGCATPKSNFPVELSLPPVTMYLVAGDELDITFLGAVDLNTVQKIRRDGKISLKLVGDVDAAGKTPGELRAALIKVYSSQLQIKEVSVIVRTPPPVLVSGAVLKAGAIELSHPMTALEAIMAAGGFDETKAEVRTVIVIRHDGEKCYGYSLNLQPALKGKDLMPFYLEPFDIVYVPQTFVAKINKWVDQYVNRMIPTLGWSIDDQGRSAIYR